MKTQKLTDAAIYIGFALFWVGAFWMLSKVSPSTEVSVRQAQAMERIADAVEKCGQR